ncbi:Ig-like domain repeat protein [Streptomyces sp. NBC_01614]|uniref:Ig-like domain repeat protein n=1 Tax=Streptomyces sp. NBC_01614 TaxID=2975897 RepID=UPI0038681502
MIRAVNFPHFISSWLTAAIVVAAATLSLIVVASPAEAESFTTSNPDETTLSATAESLAGEIKVTVSAGYLHPWYGGPGSVSRYASVESDGQQILVDMGTPESGGSSYSFGLRGSGILKDMSADSHEITVRWSYTGGHLCPCVSPMELTFTAKAGPKYPILNISPNSASVGEESIYTATFPNSDQMPTGRVFFSTSDSVEGSFASASIASDGKASVASKALSGSAGNVKVWAIFLGDASHPMSTSVPMPLTVGSVNPLSVTTSGLPGATVGSEYRHELTGSGGSGHYTFSVSGLPEGMTFSESGEITGTPVERADASVTVKVTDAQEPARTASKTLNLRVAGAASKTAVTVSRVTAAGEVVGSDGRVTIDKGQRIRVDADVTDSEGRPLGGTVSFRAVNDDDRTASPDLGTVTLDGDGHASVTKDITEIGSFKVVVSYSGDRTHEPSVSDPVPLTVHSLPVITTGSLPSARFGSPYSQQLTAGGGTPPYTWRLVEGTSLAAGLELNGSTGVVSGTPTAVGTDFSTTFMVTDSLGGSDPRPGAGTRQILFNVGLAETQVVLEPSRSPAVAGQKLTVTAHVTEKNGGTAVPTGTINFATSADGVDFTFLDPIAVDSHGMAEISYTPGKTPYTMFEARYNGDTNNFPSDTARLTVRTVPALDVTWADLPAGTAGQSYPDTKVASPSGGSPNPDGTTSYTYSLATGTLPPGLTLDKTTGIISGTPTATGESTFTLTVSSDGSPQQSASKDYELLINGTVTTLSASQNPAIAGREISLVAQVTTTGAHPPTGTVTFAYTEDPDGAGPQTALIGTATPDAAGLAKLPVTLAAGTHLITASYGGDPENPPGAPAATLSQIIVPALDVTWADLPAGTAGQSYPDTKVASPSGGSPNPDGTTSYTYSLATGTLPPGLTLDKTTGIISGTPTATGTTSFALLVSNGTGELQQQSAPHQASITVDKTTTSTKISSSANPAGPSQKITLTATVTGTNPTGRVTFKDGTTTIGTIPLNNSGQAGLLKTLTRGEHKITAVYSGDSRNTGSTADAFTQRVVSSDVKTTLTANPTSITSGGSLTYTLTVTNNGPDTAHAVQAGLNPAPGITIKNTDRQTTGTPTTINGTTYPTAWNLSDLTPRQTITITIKATATGKAKTKLTTTATAAPANPQTDTTTTNNTSKTTITIKK